MDNGEIAAVLREIAVIGAGDTKVSIRREGLQVDFRIVPEESYPAALQHFTGSKDHNTLLRGRAKAMGLKMSEWGVYGQNGEPLPLEDEVDVYSRAGLPGSRRNCAKRTGRSRPRRPEPSRFSWRSRTFAG